jgi:hypothetical protein
MSNLSQLEEHDEPPKVQHNQLSSFSKFRKNNRRTAEVSVSESSSDDEQEENNQNAHLAKKAESRQIVQANKPKKKRKRRDVIFKRILRECRRFFQSHLSELTGFVASKKPRKDDHFYL